MISSIAESELKSYLEDEILPVFEICDKVEACEIWFEDQGMSVYFNDIFADITDDNGKTARVCIAEDGRKTDDTLLLKIKEVELNDNMEVILKAEIAVIDDED